MRMRWPTGATFRGVQNLNDRMGPQTIAETKWPRNPPWHFVAELEKRIERLERDNAELKALIKDLLAALHEPEESDGDR